MFKTVALRPAQTSPKMGAEGCSQFRSLFEQYDWPVDTAIAICNMESGGHPEAVNGKDSHVGCTGSYGLMQIACIHTNDVEGLKNPEINVKIAHQLWKTEGFKPWTTYARITVDNSPVHKIPL